MYWYSHSCFQERSDKGMELLKLLSTNEIVAQILSFLLLFFLLRAFAWKKLLKLLQMRKERILAEFKRIEDEKSAIEKIKSEYNDKLKSIESAARGKIEQAILEGEKLREELKKVAGQEAEKILARAQNDIKSEIAKAKAGLKDQIGQLVLEAAEKVLGEKVTAREDKRIVDKFIEGIDNLK